MRQPQKSTRKRSVAQARQAYVTLLTSDGYLPGAECLLHSLRQSGTRRPVVKRPGRMYNVQP